MGEFFKKKKIPFFFFLEGSWVQDLLAFLCGVCRFSPVCLGSLQVLQLSLSVPGQLPTPIVLGGECVWIFVYSHPAKSSSRVGSGRTRPHHSHNPARGKRWMNTHPYIQICVFVWVVYGWLFRGLRLKRKKRMNKFDSISVSCVMAL